MSDKDTCPVNGCNLQGGKIPMPAKGFYEPGVTHYSRMIGHEVPGVYDGVLYWACPDCGARWHRFKPYGWAILLNQAAQPYIDAPVTEVVA
jgi:hypothetical protein